MLLLFTYIRVSADLLKSPPQDLLQHLQSSFKPLFSPAVNTHCLDSPHQTTPSHPQLLPARRCKSFADFGTVIDNYFLFLYQAARVVNAPLNSSRELLLVLKPVRRRRQAGVGGCLLPLVSGNSCFNAGMQHWKEKQRRRRKQTAAPSLNKSIFFCSVRLSLHFCLLWWILLLLSCF